MRILCSEYEVINSGTLLSPDLSDTKFVVSENPLMEIVCRISMGEGDSGISIELLGESTLALIFKNPNGLGYGHAMPIKVGHLNGRALYVSFRVSLRGNNDSYVLEYTFYIKEAV